MEFETIGPYRVERHLGSGGMGTVYLAWDDRLKRKVAIKSIHPNKELSDERLERLRREAQAIAGINHPSVTQVFDILRQDGREFIVMEYVEGQSLTALLTEAPIPAGRAVEIAQQIAEGLSAAHAQGVIHRDLKPENVMLDSSGRVKILDFGLAKSISPDDDQESLTEEGMVMGTSRAMSPEQAKGQEVDERSDLFSLGSIVYELVTGQHPFQASNPLDTMHRIVSHRPKPVLRLRTNVPVELGLLVERLLEKDRKHRPGTAKEVSVALKVLSEGDSTKTGDLTTLDKLTAPARRRRNFRRFWPLGLAAIAVIVAGVVGWHWFESTRPIETIAVAVLKPAAEGESKNPKADIFADALRVTLVNEAAALDELIVIDPRDVDQVGQNPRAIARAVAADEVIETKFTRLQAGMWRVTLQRLIPVTDDQDLLKVEWGSEPFDVPDDDLSLLGGVIASQLQNGYPDSQQMEGKFNSSASPEEYATYFNARRRIRNPSAGQRYEIILEELGDIVRRAPHLLEARLSEARVATYLYQVTHDEEYLNRARNIVTGIQRTAPSDIRTYKAVAQQALLSGDLESAEIAISAGRRIAPADPMLLEAEASLEQARGNSSRARAILAKLTEQRPSFSSFFDLAHHDLYHGRPEAARTSLEAALTLAPKHRSVRSKLAELELLHGDVGRSVSLYEGLIAESPSFVYLANLGTAQMLQSDFEHATETFRRASEIAPTAAVVLMGLGDSLTLQGNTEAAEEWYRSALAALEASEQPDELEALDTEAQCLAHLGQNMEAVAAVQKRLRLAEDDMESHFTAALVYTIIGEPTSALVSAERAVELGLDVRWLALPWFEPLRDEDAFLALVGPSPES
ncbi:MAG: protein kinase [bacterium]|nr:protein kinase [bacterium]